MEGVDRLREHFEGEMRAWRMTSEAFAEVDSMLRDIEREHEGALKTDADSTSYDLGYMAGRAAVMREHEGMRRFCKTLEGSVEKHGEVEMFGVCYAPLPVDRDGVAIRPGDALETCDGGTPLSCKVAYVAWDGEDWAVEEDFDEAPSFFSNFRDLRHTKAATVEDTLREFAFQVGQSATDDGIVAKYAAKLRMAE
jgi:hypothetical protein